MRKEFQRFNLLTLQSVPGLINFELQVRKLLNSGTLYFSHSSAPANGLDLTLCAQRRQKASDTDNRFFW